MKRVYLCGRIAADAQALNKQVIVALREAGYVVFAPQEQEINNGDRYDARTIFLMDYDALRAADVVVAVGRLGADCGWELGYAWAQNIPVVFVPGDDHSWQKSPMLIPTLQQYRACTLSNVVERVSVATHLEEL